MDRNAYYIRGSIDDPPPRRIPRNGARRGLITGRGITINGKTKTTTKRTNGKIAVPATTTTKPGTDNAFAAAFAARFNAAVKSGRLSADTRDAYARESAVTASDSAGRRADIPKRDFTFAERRATGKIGKPAGYESGDIVRVIVAADRDGNPKRATGSSGARYARYAIRANDRSTVAAFAASGAEPIDFSYDAGNGYIAVFDPRSPFASVDIAIVREYVATFGAIGKLNGGSSNGTGPRVARNAPVPAKFAERIAASSNAAKRAVRAERRAATVKSVEPTDAPATVEPTDAPATVEPTDAPATVEPTTERATPAPVSPIFA